MLNKTAIILTILGICALPLYAQLIQEEEVVVQTVNLNNKYRYPFSFGFDYTSFSPMALGGTNYGGEFTLTDLALTGRLPLKAMPRLQPTLKLGLLNVGAALSDVENQKFDHLEPYLMVGADFLNKVSKEFEIGGGAALGVGMGLYNGLIEDSTDTRSSYEILASLEGRVGLNLSYNLNLELKPQIRYSKSLSPLTRFDGFTFGMGISGSYRLGIDPDAPQAQIRSIRFEDAKMPPLFAAMQSYYADHPVGYVTIRNVEKFSITDVIISFFQGGFMDSPTQAASLSSLEPGETREVPLFALFNQDVFLTEGITPLTGEIQVTYNSEGRTANQSVSITYDLHDKEAMTWNDDNKVASFITPADAALRNYVSFIRQANRDAVKPGYSAQVQTAMQIYYALGELGILYQLDPTSPFDAAQENPLIVDAVSLPRNTLVRGTGDCDDLTVLYSALLEAAGMESAFITVPGHIYAAFNTKVPARDYQLIHPDKRMTLPIEGELWVPVEITMIGNTDFSTAWRIGVDEWEAVTDPEKRNIYFTRKAQETFRPVGLRERDLGLQYGDKSQIVADFSGEIDKVVQTVVADFTASAQEKGNKGSYNKLGIVCAQFGEYVLAERAFNNALALDRNYLAPKINLGNVYYMKGEFQNALRMLHGVEETMIQGGKESTESYATVLLNISRCYYEIENYEKSAEYSEKLTRINPEMAARFSYLAGSGGSRASDVSAYSEIRFAEEE